MTVTAAVIVRGSRVVGGGTNRPVHDSFCPRTALRCPSGVGYEFCPDFCHPDNHAEGQAIRDAAARAEPTRGADLYLTGHWWLCQPCWEKVDAAGITNVYLVEGATERFARAVAPKGEPRVTIRVRLRGVNVDETLAAALRAVMVEVTDENGADLDFTAQPNWRREELLVNLSRALAAAGVYRRAAG
jgi:deoxycytidylate deaminase